MHRKAALDERPRLRAEIDSQIAADEINERDAVDVVSRAVGGGVEVARVLAQQQVIPAAADQLVDSVTAHEGVVSAAATQKVCRRVALDFVISIAAEDVLDVGGDVVAFALAAVV